MRTAFVTCVERGVLEADALLLCRSIRHFGGAFARAEIHTFAPRPALRPSATTVRALDALDVEYHEEPVNLAWDSEGPANKIVVCAWAERELDCDLLVLVDTDTVFLAEPAALGLAAGIDAAVRPVDFKLEGSAGPDDPLHEAAWAQMFASCGRRLPPWGQAQVATTVERRAIRPYFNSGLVAARRRAGVFSRWRDDYAALVDHGWRPVGGAAFFLDQLALAVTLTRDLERVALLDWRYNYPLPHHERLATGRAAAVSELVHLHHHGVLRQHGFLDGLAPALERDGEAGAWLDAQLPIRAADEQIPAKDPAWTA